MTPEMSEQIFNLTLAALSAVVTLVLVPLMRTYGQKLVGKLEADGKDARLITATIRLAGLVEDAMREVEQTFVRRMKAHGKWDGMAAEIARDTAVSVVMRHLGDGAGEVMNALNIKDADIFAGKLRTMVEAAVSRTNGESEPSSEDAFVPMRGSDSEPEGDES